MYNAYVATRQKARKQREDSPATAGTPKAPAGGAKSREELKALGERNGWASRDLSMREIQNMSADEVLWHETFNRENFDSALTRAENQRVNRERQTVWDIRKKWEGTVGVTPQEAEQARRSGAAFAERFPTFERSEANALEICQYMADHDLDPKQVSSYVTAFNALAETGQIKLAPVQSADEYLTQHPELHDTRIPPLVSARHQREQNTEAHFAAASTAMSESTVTRVVDYGEQKHGVPPESEKYSFKMKIRAMSADELAQRCADDPAFKKVLDELK